MAAAGTRKVTVELPVDLLERAQRATQAGVTETLRAGLRELAAADAFEGLKRLRGKVRFGMTWRELKGKEPLEEAVHAGAAARHKG